jgi:hypothetical protein
MAFWFPHGVENLSLRVGRGKKKGHFSFFGDIVKDRRKKRRWAPKWANVGKPRGAP